MNRNRMAPSLNSTSCVRKSCSFTGHNNDSCYLHICKFHPEKYCFLPYRKTMPGLYKLLLHWAVTCVLMRTIYAAKFEKDLEPSQQLLGSEHLTEMRKESFTEFDIEDLTLGNANTDGRKSMRLIAVVGQLFNRSITEELKRFDSNLVEADSVIKVRF